MSIRIFCRECDNDGNPRENNRGGFEINNLTAIMFSMDDYKPDVANTRGYEQTSDPVRALFEACKDGRIECCDCKSHNVEVVCESDVELMRDQQEVLDGVDFGKISGDVVGEIKINTDSDVNVPQMSLSNGKKPVSNIDLSDEKGLSLPDNLSDKMSDDDFSVGDLTF